MKIYINDIPVRIRTTLKNPKKEFDLYLSGNKEFINVDTMKGRVLMENKSIDAIDNLLKLMTTKKYKKIKSLDILIKNQEKAESYLKSHFTLIEAAGGVVEKEGKILMILRNGLWDIPKGKMEKGENKQEAAIREVEEETGVKVEIIDKVCSTWHTYIRNKKYVLKRTYWYRMKCLNDKKMKPQKEEGIKEVVWMNEAEVDLALHHTFKTIGRLVKKYRKETEKEKAA